MGEALTPRGGASEDPRASELDVRLEQVGAALLEMRQAADSLQELETRLAAMTAECTHVLGRWAQNDERNAAAVLELHGRLGEWNDIERRLLQESRTRMQQFERSVQHEWQALRARQEEPLKRLDAEAARVAQTCLAAVDQALGGFARAESRLAAMEAQLHREMGDLAREVRTAVADLRVQQPQLAERQPWSLDNVVRLHSELRAEPRAGAANAALPLAPAAVTSGTLALDRRADVPSTAALTLPHTTSDPVPFWRQPSMLALGFAILVAAAGGLSLYAYAQAGFRDAAARAEAAERGAAQARIEAGREISTVRQQANQRVSSAEETARGAQMLASILAASDLRRFDLLDGATGRRAAQVLWSRAEGVAFSGPRLASPPAGRTYQLWLLTPSTSTSAGLLSVGSTGRTRVTFAPPPVLPRPVVGASLTVEPLSGSAHPTGAVYLQSPTRDAVVPAAQ